MGFQVKKAKREKIFVKIALMAPSGGGKTYGSLRLATGMADEIEKTTGKRPSILLGNTEQKRGYYYADEFDYDIVDIDAPYSPEKFVELVKFAVDNDYGILIIDSSSHEWEGTGGCLELHKKAGGRYQDWEKVTPRHDAFIHAIADSEIHVIATMRGKDAYEMEKDSSGKTTVQKVGVGAKQREGFEYEFTCTFLIDQKTSTSTVQKDNTHLFDTQGAVLLSEDHGRQIIKWANSGSGYTPVVRKENSTEVTTDELKDLKKEIVALCTSLGGTKNEKLMTTLKEIEPSGNPNKISNIETAKQLLEALQNLQ